MLTDDRYVMLIYIYIYQKRQSLVTTLRSGGNCFETNSVQICSVVYAAHPWRGKNHQRTDDFKSTSECMEDNSMATRSIKESSCFCWDATEARRSPHKKYIYIEEVEHKPSVPNYVLVARTPRHKDGKFKYVWFHVFCWISKISSDWACS